MKVSPPASLFSIVYTDFQSMDAKRYVAVAVFAALVFAGAVTLFVQSALRKDAPRNSTGTPTIPKQAIQPQNASIAHLYFGDQENMYLISEERIVRHAEDPTHFSRKIVEALIKGPKRGLTRTIPKNTTLRALYITAKGICYVDLSAAIRENHPGGVDTERLTLYSIVNSLVLNIPEIQAVKILIEGQESTTLAGHIGLQEPADANMLLIR
jgi:spore germination protein GerM